jgi:[FeFe] hydrogenase H-cluster maturation GTPase HydF
MSSVNPDRKGNKGKLGAMRGFRTHIGIYGRRNVGKSSLINALTRQDVAIVSDVPGTTTDPVAKPMELQPLGPVVFIDTAGMDDTGELGVKRNDRSRAMLNRCDVVLLTAGAGVWESYEEDLLEDLEKRGVPVIVVFNQSDLGQVDPELRARLVEQVSAVIETVATTREGIEELRRTIVDFAPPEAEQNPAMLRDLVPPKELCVLVVPIDKEAPVGRLIMPQVNAIRDLLDGDCQCLVVKESELAEALDNLKRPPALVVTDSQAFREVEAVVPRDVPMTGFSVLMARLRGDLQAQAEAAKVIDQLQSGDEVLVAESCTHHPVEDDIGRVKLPRWINEKIGGEVKYTTVQGHDFPDDLSRFKLAIHCGGCTMNRTEILSRLCLCQNEGVPMTNYGLAIAQCFGILDRALEPFALARGRQG